MAITVNLSAPLVKKTGGAKKITLQSTTINQMINDLKPKFPDLVETICTSDGNIKNVVSIYLNDSDIRSLEGRDTTIDEGDEIFIIPTIAGG